MRSVLHSSMAGVMLVASLLVVGCGDGETEVVSTNGDTNSEQSRTDAGSEDDGGCEPGPNASGDPRSVDEAVALVNSLPNPTSLECFLEALDRPLELRATSSTVSLQPAVGKRSPRLFILADPLFMSVVPEGSGRPLLEFGELVEGVDSLKAEIEFPVTGEITPHDTYDRIRHEDQGGTKCNTCHGSERSAPEIDPAAYVSRAFRPDPKKIVPIEDVRNEYRSCNPSEEPERCSLLDALFGEGPVRERPFPEQLPTIFEANE